jgi:hypothetical protein
VKAHSVKWAEAFTEKVKGLYGKAVLFFVGIWYFFIEK